VLIQGRWYAVHVRRNSEKVVARHLEEKAYEQFVPTYTSVRRWKQRVVRSERPLFENYVFCRITALATAPIVTTPGVIRIVGAAGQPIPVDDQEIDALLRIVTSGLRVEPWPYHHVGRRVRVESGPLRGIEGILCKVVHDERLVVAITLLQRAVNVELDSSTVLPIESDAQAIREMLNHASSA
jgi:transcription antitermination factor NusG